MPTITAESIVEYAKQNNIKIASFGIDMEKHRVNNAPIRCCVRAVVRHMFCPESSMYGGTFFYKTGLTEREASGLENGFEVIPYNAKFNDKTFYEIGQEVARLALLAS